MQSEHHYKGAIIWDKSLLKFSLNVFTDFSEFSDKKFKIKKIAVFQTTIPYARDIGDTTVPQRHK